ncbi:hypothetical protein LPJ53_002830 [Coemansia erecta]|uniref:Alpha-ketoglutarate-dependent dioxygenase AlkB-like domain-containing protein n=1 Tax=Coemansia erecta TaxID=147472 RepID=A0A9W7XXF5_9FUNG|nr:hypothetical protein LPJ53_002830 [Coemansia erecta]
MADEQPSRQGQQQTAFRRCEKRYSRRDQELDLSGVIDFRSVDAPWPPTNNADGVRRVRLTHDLATPSSLPLEVFRQKRPPAYALEAHPGLIVIPDALTDAGQRWLARKCLCDCTRSPNRTNLDPFFEMPDRSLFSLAFSPEPPAGQAADAHSASVSGAMQGRTTMIRSRAETDSVQADVTRPKGKFYTQSETPAGLLGHLRWCTLGQQYNWTTKQYDLGTSTFDKDLDALMRAIAEAITDPVIILGHADDEQPQPWPSSYDGRMFVSQAGIVNFYDQRTTMAGHVDKTEENMDAPLISTSVGLTCVYLVGGVTRDTEPTAFLLRSGDVLAMCGRSRLAFHGVPRVLPDTAPLYLSDPESGATDVEATEYPQWGHFAEYLATHRINCNARKCS